MADRGLNTAESNKLCAFQIETCALAIALSGLSNHNLRRKSSTTVIKPTAASRIGKPWNVVSHLPCGCQPSQWLLILQPLGFVCILVFTGGELSIIAALLQNYRIFLLDHWVFVCAKWNVSSNTWQTESPFLEQLGSQTTHCCWNQHLSLWPELLWESLWEMPSNRLTFWGDRQAYFSEIFKICVYPNVKKGFPDLF